MSGLLEWQLLALAGKGEGAGVSLRAWYEAQKDKHQPYLTDDSPRYTLTPAGRAHLEGMK